ncbi:hypothetical protein [Croceicoccus sp. YJ47]|uniref:hypothetical protein n=1 Tax=Croceicoccus sp. YJ47 TaxID=2798724 RepID=UPI0019228DDD|nr:hypothetical protein [Croceicoccus sp. YJ47]QQN73940.1 hypothetical protein JD971_14515 [Croceicoccus sp. YJ47]
MRSPNNGAFLADLSSALPDSTIRKRWQAGDYGPIRTDYARQWWKLAGRAPAEHD